MTKEQMIEYILASEIDTICQWVKYKEWAELENYLRGALGLDALTKAELQEEYSAFFEET